MSKSGSKKGERMNFNASIAVLLLVLLCGCFQAKDELTLEPDGSGKVRIETRVLIASEAISMMGTGMRMGANEPIICPPLSEADARRLFPAKDFKVTVKTEKAANDEQTVIVEASFKDVNALLNSPYGRAHALSLTVEAGKLVLKALSGVEAAARFSDMEGKGGLFGEQMPEELLKRRNELRHEFRLTLPTNVTTASGPHEGRTITWIVDHTRQTNTTEFAQLAGRVLEASCSADALKIKPVTPARLALSSFNNAPSGTLAANTAGPDPEKVKSAAKFVPYALQVTRSLDLSGEGGANENQAQLFGAIVLPVEFAPQKWGELKLEEVVDAKGNNLKSEGDRADFFGGNFAGKPADEEIDANESEPKSNEERKPLTLRFQPPDWKVKEIGRIKASIALQYLGGAQQIIKLTNAVPAKWIHDVSKAQDFSDVELDADGRALSHPALPELGLTLNYQMGMAQKNFTTLMLQVGGKKSLLSDAQAYDSTGRPWPTFLQREMMGENDACSITVAGRPSPPLSLALLVTSVGADVEVPILLEKVPVGRQ